MVTCISHFYNEEYLLPYFLKHHTQIFDHGVLIDYASTDNSAAICKEYAPDWEVRQSRNSDFNAGACDAEVMDIERSVAGWKCVLTTTEFLCGDIKSLTQQWDIQGSAAAQIRPCAIVDLKNRDPVLGEQRSPLEYCHTGYMDGWITPYKSRLIHTHPDGQYSVGRHTTGLKDVLWHPEGALLKWFGFAPWTSAMRARKMAIQTRMPQSDIDAGLGFQHILDDEKLTLMWQSEVAISGDLREVPGYF